MRQPVHALVQRLTGKASLEECSVEEIRHTAQRFPFFAPAQFLLLQKLRQAGFGEEADAQHRKAVLFYPDPLQFEVFIAEELFAGDAEMPLTETVMPSSIEEVEPPSFSAVETDSDNLSAEENQVSVESEVPAEPQEAATIQGITEIPQPEPVDEPGQRIEERVPEPVIEETEPEITKPAFSFKPAADESTFNIPIEPYHTVDYFASQGIRIANDELPKDKLGKQLKSFTEWLKMMKRLPAAEPTGSADAVAEKKVESLADRSLASGEVLTEAMAEVWAKQGATEKALDIYNKLSLHNPSKRAYFAAKIENLKQS